MRRIPAVLLAAFCLCAGGPVLAKPDSDTLVHKVAPGQVLGTIAARYGVTVTELCRANAIDSKKPIRPGQRLVVPARSGAPSEASTSRLKVKVPPIPPPPPGASWAEYVKPAWKRGYVTIAGHGRSWSGYVFGPGGEVLPAAQRRIAWVLASWRTGKQVPVNERLIRLVARMSDTFGGRPMRIVSGYRERSHARNSKHKAGEALDFSIPGVPNDVLRDYLRTLRDVGVGYYPNSTHVHLDVRKGSGYWVDDSKPGQRPAYRKKVAGTKKRPPPSRDAAPSKPLVEAPAPSKDAPRQENPPVRAPAGPLASR